MDSDSHADFTPSQHIKNSNQLTGVNSQPLQSAHQNAISESTNKGGGVTHHGESVSIDLSNQKVIGTAQGSQLELDQAQAQQLFSKTTTNEFLAIGSQVSGGPGIPLDGQLVSNMLDSQASSPTMRSDLALRTTAQFMQGNLPTAGSDTRHEVQEPGIMSQSNMANNHRRGSPGQQTYQPWQEVLASSGPGGVGTQQQHVQSSHLKSQSTSNTNYFSNISVQQNEIQPSGVATTTGFHQSNNFEFGTAGVTGGKAISQGRSTETRHKKQADSQHIHGLQNQGKTAKSAVLYGGGASGSKGNQNREIKRIPSKTKGSEKGLKRRMKDQHAHTHGNEAHVQNHSQSSQGGTNPRGQRQSSQTNRLLMQNAETAHHTSNQPTSVHTTPHMPSQMANMYGHQQPGGPLPMPTGDQYQGFQFVAPIAQNPFQFATQAMPAGLTPQQQHQFLAASSQMSYHPMQPQPQVHFIAKQQKFYGISPERAPLIFKQSSQEKRPYTSSGHVLTKRVGNSKVNAQSSAIAALYLGSKTHQNGFGLSHAAAHGQHQQPRNNSQPIDDFSNMHGGATAAAYSMQNFPVKQVPGQGPSAKKISGLHHHQGVVTAGHNSNSAHVTRKDKTAVGSLSAHSSIYGATSSGAGQKMPEQLQEDVLRLKQIVNTHKEENVKLKTKIKILENEMGRKERTLEDFLQQNQFIQNAQKNSNSGILAPIVQTAQRYQAETFLVMSLKKQVKEQKAELQRKDEELLNAKKNIKNTKFFEMDQELKLYKDELIRMRYLLEQAYSSAAAQDFNTAEFAAPTSGRPSATGIHNQPVGQSPFLIAQNSSQPNFGASNGFSKAGSTSQTNFFPDTTSNMSLQQFPSTAHKQATSGTTAGYQATTMSANDDQVSNGTSENRETQLPPLRTQSNVANPQVMQSTPQTSQMTGTAHGFMNMSEHTSALGTQLTQGQPPITGVLSLSDVNTRENEFVAQLTLQIQEKDSMIRKLQQQVDEFSRQRLARLQNATQAQQSTTSSGQASEGKGGSAGPNSKTELARIKKLVREKDKEIIKLRQENAQALIKSGQEEEQEKKLKQLQSQVSTYLKKNNEMKAELRKRDDKNEQLAKDLEQAAEQQKQSADQQNREQSQALKQLQAQVEEMTKKVADSETESKRLSTELELTSKVVQEKEQMLLEKSKKTTEPEKEKEEPKPEAPKPETSSKAEVDEPSIKTLESSSKPEPRLDGKAEGELGLIATVLGCRENRDRIEFALDLQEFCKKQQMSPEQRKKYEVSHLGLASDYKLNVSPLLVIFIMEASAAHLAQCMPKYDFISPSLALIIMQEIRKMLTDVELMEILCEKDQETRLPFDALRDLCSRFDRNFTDEHCAFITASYLKEIDEGIIYINFKEFLIDLKDPRGTREFDLTSSKHRATSSIGSEGSDSETRALMRTKHSPISDILARSGGKGGSIGRAKKSVDEEQMLDVSEAIFLKMADLMIDKGRSVRGIFSKYSVPEIFPDRTILELLSPSGFIEGIKDTGIEDLQEFEVACLMRVLAKPELDNAIILNEFVMIMENFGVMDGSEEDEEDDYMPDTTEQSIANLDGASNADLDDEQEAEENGDKKADSKSADAKTAGDKGDKVDKDENAKSKEADDKKKAAKPEKKKARKHDLSKVDAKGTKILRKLARFLLKQFLHPREFFGKAISKEAIKTKKRTFTLDVLKFKDFYLRIKIANIRKRLTENASLNAEICLDKKMHPELINVKLMVKALEELAEDEQKVLLKEEKEAAEAKAKAAEEARKQTLGNEGDEVETPRSNSEIKAEESCDEKSKADPSKKAPAQAKGDSKSADDKKEKDESKELKESYGLDMIKFGNASIRSKSNNTHSPMMGERQFQILNTIEEEKNETQTSNYVENASEREDSKLLSSNQLRSSNMAGLEFLDDDQQQKVSLQKFSPDMFDKSLISRDEKVSSKSQVATSQSEIDKVSISSNIDMPMSREQNNQGRLTGRPASLKENQLSKSLAETSINRIGVDDADVAGETRNEAAPILDTESALEAPHSMPTVKEAKVKGVKDEDDGVPQVAETPDQVDK